MEKTICELFAGVGGFRLGFENYSKEWKTVWFSQWEPADKEQWAHGCYVKHFGTSLDLDGEDKTNIDIHEVDKKKIPNHTVLVGGFPCQDYSVARSLNNEKGIEGKKGVLWWDIRDTLSTKKAPFGLFENVDRLLKSPSKQRGRDFGIILSCLAGLGYNAEWRVINAAQYGGPQRRRRIFIFVYKKHTSYAHELLKEFGKMKLAGKVEHVEKILTENGFFAQQFPVKPGIKMEMPQKIVKGKNNEDLVKITQDFKFDFKNAGCMINDTIYTARVTEVEEKEIPLGAILQNNSDYPEYNDSCRYGKFKSKYPVEDKYYIAGEKLYYEDTGKKFYNEFEEGTPTADIKSTWQYLKGGKKLRRITRKKDENGNEEEFEYTFSEGAISFLDEWDKPARTMLTSESSFNRSTHIIKDMVTGQIRILTPIEAERIQGFDDNWTEYASMPIKDEHNNIVTREDKVMPDKKRYFMMGNALVVPMITRMAKTIDGIVERENNSCDA